MFGTDSFVMVFPQTYTGSPALHAVIHIAGCDGDEVVVQTKQNKSLGPRVQQLFSEFAWIFVLGTTTAKAKWRGSLNEWIKQLCDRLSPAFSSMSLLGFSRGAMWASHLAYSRPRMFRCVILLGGYPSSNGQEDMCQEAAGLCGAVVAANILVISSRGDTLSPPTAYTAWLDSFRCLGAGVVVHDTWDHARLSTAFVHGHVEGDTAAEELLDRMHAMLRP
jgi:pimeloyl-ACP methyl ester carboxylesterase